MLTVLISRVYSSPMPKFVYVYPKGASAPVKLDADTVVEEAGTTRLTVKKGQVQVGLFYDNEIVGWWVQEEDEAPGN